jgi:hypothetical protein
VARHHTPRRPIRLTPRGERLAWWAAGLAVCAFLAAAVPTLAEILAPAATTAGQFVMPALAGAGLVSAAWSLTNAIRDDR